MVLFVFLLQVSTMTMAWFSLKALFRDKPKLRVSGLFGCMHKTISIGVPLITVLFRGSPNISLYTLPILIWHPMQLVIGTLLMPRLTAFVISETERLHHHNNHHSANQKESEEAPAEGADNMVKAAEEGKSHHTSTTEEGMSPKMTDVDLSN